MNTPAPFSLPKSLESLRLGDLLRMLVSDGRIEKVMAEKLHQDRKRDSSKTHPIVVVAEQKWQDQRE